MREAILTPSEESPSELPATRLPRIVPRSDHCLSRSQISENALKVLYRLHRSGFTAYLVGGAVRDLLLGRRPKDFDVGTNARPQQVRQLFRNARLIGRRFRLARVVFADEVVEVATFRRSPEPPEMEDGDTSDVLAPTVEVTEYGTPEEDARRRDFTVNGLFYNIADFTIIDYVDGLADLAAGVIRTIGPPRERIGEDPVRMMRAVEYAARLEFRLDEPLEEAIHGMAAEIHRAAPARIAYELLESLRGGHAHAVFRGFERHGLLTQLLPEVAASSTSAEGALLWRLLAAVDAASATGNPLPDEGLLAALILPQVAPWLSRAAGDGAGFERAVRTVTTALVTRLMLSHHTAHVMRSAFLCLSRLAVPPRGGKWVVRTMRQEGYVVAVRLARALAQEGSFSREALDLWERAVARAEAGMSPVPEAPVVTGRRRRRRPRRRRASPGGRPA